MKDSSPRYWMWDSTYFGAQIHSVNFEPKAPSARKRWRGICLEAENSMKNSAPFRPWVIAQCVISTDRRSFSAALDPL